MVIYIGSRFEYPVYQDKGRIGLRATVPFRVVRVERDHHQESVEQACQDILIKGSRIVQFPVSNTSAANTVVPGFPAAKTVDNNDGNSGNNKVGLQNSRLYRFNVIENLLWTSGGEKKKAIVFDGTKVYVLNRLYNKHGNRYYNDDPNGGAYSNGDIAFALLYSEDPDSPPKDIMGALALDDTLRYKRGNDDKDVLYYYDAADARDRVKVAKTVSYTHLTLPTN